MKAPEYRAEYAATNRSTCVRCHQGIRKNDVRLGIVVKADFEDGKDIQWHHLRCFFQRKPNVDVDKIRRFHDLLWTDQLRIRKLSAGRKDATDDSENETPSEDEDPTLKNGKSGGESDGEDGSLKSQSGPAEEGKDEASQLPIKAMKAISEENNQHDLITKKTEEAEEIREMSDDAENVNVSRVKQRKPGKHIDSKKAKPGKSLGKEKRRPGKPVDKDRVIIRLKTMLSSVNREAAALGMLGAKIEARVRLLEKENATLKAELEERSAQLTAQACFAGSNLSTGTLSAEHFVMLRSLRVRWEVDERSPQSRREPAGKIEASPVDQSEKTVPFLDPKRIMVSMSVSSKTKKVIIEILVYFLSCIIALVFSGKVVAFD